MKHIALVLTLSIAGIAHAQWTTDVQANTFAGGSVLSILDAMAGADGSTHIVYWKSVGAPNNIELRLQKLDAAGNPTYGVDGMLVSSAINMSTSTAIGRAVMDGNDNLYIGITATGDEMGHVFKLDSDGNHLWPEEGVTFPTGYGIIILPMSNGDAMVSWLNIPNALMQRYNSTGEAIWPAPVAVVSGSSKTAPGEFFELSDGDVEMIFHTYNFGISSTLMAQRYDGVSGTAIWSAPVQLSNKVTNWNTRYSVGQINDVTYIGYKAATGLRFDSFLQRIDPDGALPWGINGSDFDINETDYEMDTRIAVNGTEIWSLCNYKNPSQAENGERIQKFNSETGARLLTDYAKQVFPIGSDIVHASDLHLREGEPVFLIENGFDTGVSVTELDLVALDSNGEFVWPETMQPMATFEASKSNTRLTELVNGQTVAVWMEDKSAGPAVYAQNFAFESGNNAVIEQGLSDRIAVHPNPANTSFSLQLHPSLRGNVEVCLYQSTGSLLECRHFQAVEDRLPMAWEVSDWPAGLYHLVVQSNALDRPVNCTFMITH